MRRFVHKAQAKNGHPMRCTSMEAVSAYCEKPVKGKYRRVRLAERYTIRSKGKRIRRHK